MVVCHKQRGGAMDRVCGYIVSPGALPLPLTKLLCRHKWEDFFWSGNNSKNYNYKTAFWCAKYKYGGGRQCLLHYKLAMCSVSTVMASKLDQQS